MAKIITSQNFEEEVLKSEKPILLDFWATWCGPCMRQGPIVEALAEEGYNVGKIDVDQEMGLAQQFKGMQPGAAGGKTPPAAGKEPKDMNYDELCAYLEANPGAKLE